MARSIGRSTSYRGRRRPGRLAAMGSADSDVSVFEGDASRPRGFALRDASGAGAARAWSAGDGSPDPARPPTCLTGDRPAVRVGVCPFGGGVSSRLRAQQSIRRNRQHAEREQLARVRVARHRRRPASMSTEPEAPSRQRLPIGDHHTFGRATALIVGTPRAGQEPARREWHRAHRRTMTRCARPISREVGTAFS